MQKNLAGQVPHDSAASTYVDCASDSESRHPPSLQPVCNSSHSHSTLFSDATTTASSHCLCLRIASVMASLNLSLNGQEISKSYQRVVDSSLPTGPSSSPTFAQWAVLSVSSPLVNAFQPSGANKESVLKVQSSGGEGLSSCSEVRELIGYAKRASCRT